jgi:hypothetical protein
MSDLPELKNEPTVDMPRGDLEDFSPGYRSARDQRPDRFDEPHKSRFRYLPILLAILMVIIGGWHWIDANQLEERFNRNIEDSTKELSLKFSASVDVNPLTNLVDLQVTLKVGRSDATYEYVEGEILEYVRKELEPLAERDLSAVARRDNDLYAMIVPYQVSISIDKVRAPQLTPPSRMVQEIQRQLSAHGYNPGLADGRLGERTRIAIEQFQRDRGVAIDGRATSELLALLRGQ